MVDAKGFVDREATLSGWSRRRRRQNNCSNSHSSQQITPAGRTRENVEIERAQRFEGRAERRVRQKIIVAALKRLAQICP